MPTKTYPYGLEKLKNLVVLVPSLLFFYFGGSILSENVMNLISHGLVATEHSENSESIWVNCSR